MSAHDRHLAQFGMRTGEVECEKCEALFGVTEFHEYGQAWTEPEECPKCGADFGFDDIHESEPPDDR